MMFPVVAITSKVPVAVLPANTTAMLLVKSMSSWLPEFVSVLVKVTESVNAFAWVKVMSASSAEVVKLDAPPTFNTPVCVMFPVVAITSKVPVLALPANTTVVLLVKSMSSSLYPFASGSVEVTTSVNLLTCVKALTARSSVVGKLVPPPFTHDAVGVV